MNNLPLHLSAVLVPPMPTLNTSEPHSAVSRTKATHHTHQPFRKLRIRRLRRLQRRLTTRTHQLLRSCQCLTSSLIVLRKILQCTLLRDMTAHANYALDVHFDRRSRCFERYDSATAYMMHHCCQSFPSCTLQFSDPVSMLIHMNAPLPAGTPLHPLPSPLPSVLLPITADASDDDDCCGCGCCCFNRSACSSTNRTLAALCAVTDNGNKSIVFKHSQKQDKLNDYTFLFLLLVT